MEEAQPIQTLILDTNVLISSLVRSEGITRASLTILLHREEQEVLVPAEVIQELRAHMKDIAHKARVGRQHLEGAIEQLLARVNSVSAAVYIGYLSESLQYVDDESDAPFVALALAKSPSIIVTYNKRHFKSRLLARRGITVLTPVEVARLYFPAERVD